MIKPLIDFTGGFATDVPSELMKDNEMVSAENCQWRNGLVKRNGIVKYQTSTWTSYNGIKGIIRARLNSTWYTIVALQENLATDVVKFFYGTETTFAVIDDTFTWQAGYNVEMSYLNDHIVCVNGYNKPAVIYYSSGLLIQNLEAHDVRTRANSNWWAGQWDDSGSGTGTEWVDDTTDAQDAGTDDFQVANTTNNDGFYVSCDFVFNKIVLKGCQQAAGSPVAEYAYWNGTAWTTVTPTTAPTWTAVEGDKTIEFDIPIDASGVCLYGYRTDSTDPAGIVNKYVFRVRFTTAPSSAFSLDYIQVFHTQYLTQMMQNEKPHLVFTHNNQVYMAAGNTVNFSPVNSVTGWRDSQVEYFAEGGDKVTGFCSFNNLLLAFKENTIYSFNTSNLADPIRSRPLTTVGTIASRSPVTVGNICFFVAKDGIYAFDGNSAVPISKHIRTDINSYTLTNACGVHYKSEYWVCFPTNSIVLTADPDTYRQDETGDGRVSWYKFTGYQVHEFENCNGDSDTGYLLGITDIALPRIMRCDTAATDTLISTATNIVMTTQTKYFGMDGFMYYKRIGRIKPKIKQVSAVGGSHHIISMEAEDGTVSVPVSCMVTVGSGYWTDDISAPYTVDGKNIGLKFIHSGPTSAALIGYAIEAANRRY